MLNFKIENKLKIEIEDNEKIQKKLQPIKVKLYKI